MTELLSIDIGTTNLKALIFDEMGSIVSSAKCPSHTIYDNEGFAYYKAGEIWESVAGLIRELDEKHSLTHVSAIAVSSMGESVVPIGNDGKPLCNIIPWFDSRSLDQSRELTQQVGAGKIFSITGLDPAPVFSVPKMLWMRQHYREIYTKAVKWLQMADYINYMLTGKFVTDYTLACRTMAFDINQNTWSDEILDAAGINKDLFPKIQKSSSIVGYITSEAADSTKLTIGTPVVMGGHDHPCAAIAAGIFDGETVFDSSGTSESFLYISSKGASLPATRMGQRVGRHPDPERYILWGGIISSGISVDWAMHRLALHGDWDWGKQSPEITYDDILAACKTVPTGSEGVIFLPNLRGSGSPYWDMQMKGAFLGLTTAHSSQHLLRAVVEGLAYQARMIIEMYEGLSGVPVKRIYCAGGGAKIRLWQQIKADVTGTHVEAMKIEEATCLGTAVLAGVGIGLYKDIESGALAVKPKTVTYRPDDHNGRKYAKLYDIYCDSYRSLEKINRQLDAFVKNKY